MHLKPISRELRRELYGRRKKGYDRFGRPAPACGPCNPLRLCFLSSAAVTGPAPGIDAPAPETETEAEGAATARGAAPETDNVQGDSDLPVTTNCPSLLMSAQGFYKVCTLPNPFVYVRFFFFNDVHFH